MWTLPPTFLGVVGSQASCLPDSTFSCCLRPALSPPVPSAVVVDCHGIWRMLKTDVSVSAHTTCPLWPSQEQVTAAVAHAVEQQMQKLLEETQLDMSEFDNLLQPIIDTCTKDAISVRLSVGWGCRHLPDRPPTHPGLTLRLGRTGCSAMPSPHHTAS